MYATFAAVSGAAETICLAGRRAKWFAVVDAPPCPHCSAFYEPEMKRFSCSPKPPDPVRTPPSPLLFLFFFKTHLAWRPSGRCIGSHRALTGTLVRFLLGGGSIQNHLFFFFSFYNMSFGGSHLAVGDPLGDRFWLSPKKGELQSAADGQCCDPWDGCLCQEWVWSMYRPTAVQQLQSLVHGEPLMQ